MNSNVENTHLRQDKLNLSSLNRSVFLISSSCFSKVLLSIFLVLINSLIELRFYLAKNIPMAIFGIIGSKYLSSLTYHKAPIREMEMLF